MLVLGGFEVEEREVLEFPLNRTHAESIGKRRVDLHGLARLEDAPVLAQRHEGAHVMEPVGELDDDDANVVAHRHEHLAQVVDLRMAERLDLEAVDLGDAVDELGDGIAELLAHVLERVLGILDRIVQDGRAQGVAIHAKVGQDDCDFDGMHDERLAGLAKLALVSAFRKEVGLLDRLTIFVIQVRGCVLEENVEAIGRRIAFVARRYAVVFAHALTPLCHETRYAMPSGKMGRLKRSRSCRASALSTQPLNALNTSSSSSPSR